MATDTKSSVWNQPMQNPFDAPKTTIEAAKIATRLIVEAGLSVYVRSITREASMEASGDAAKYMQFIRAYLANTNPAIERKKRGY